LVLPWWQKECALKFRLDSRTRFFTIKFFYFAKLNRQITQVKKVFMKVIRPYLYLLSFLEGAAVMAAELIGAKMLAPYFGTSLYVWAAALGITLGGLMGGYFFGGILSRWSKDNVRTTYWTLLTGAAFLCLMPLSSQWIMQYALGFSIQMGALVSLFVFMFPPLFCMGMVSPLLINILTRDINNAGNSAGNVYAISTLGGILATFLLGFYIIPEFGITRPAVIGGATLAFFPLISIIKQNKPGGIAGLLLVATIAFGSLSFNITRSKFNIIYQSEGVLGQIKVIEFPIEDGHQGRALLVNNTLQTVIDPEDPSYSYWPYTSYIPRLLGNPKQNPYGLLLGMGGGTLTKKLDESGFKTDALELDRRIAEVAKQYFFLPESRAVIIDDARHFIRTCDPNTYDFVIFDVFKGESAPEHVLTMEAFKETGNTLKQDGLIIVNFYGYLDGERGRITRSVIRTLQEIGFHTALYATPGSPDQRNLLLRASYSQELIMNGGPELPDPIQIPDLNDAFLLTDEIPKSSYFAAAAMQWRRLNNRWYFGPE
jgi:predicted membrane-bound spermidine synthase